MKKFIRKKTIKRKCDKCGELRGTTITTEKYYCEPCMKKYFEENYREFEQEYKAEFIGIEGKYTKTDYTKVVIAIIAFVLGLLIGRLVI